MKSEKYSLVVVLPILLSLVDLLLGNSWLMSIGAVTEQNRQKVFYTLAVVAATLIAYTFIISVIKGIQSGSAGATLSIVWVVAVFGACVGFVWDVLTSITGIYKILTPTDVNASKIVAIILAIAGTSVCFIITLASPLIFANSYNNVVLRRILLPFIFLLAFCFDFYTSFIGNAALLGFPVDFSEMVRMITLGICTFLVCLCQYVVMAYVNNTDASRLKDVLNFFTPASPKY